MVKGYTDWIDIMSKITERGLEKAKRELPIEETPFDALPEVVHNLAGEIAINMAGMYDMYRRAGFNPTSAQVRVRWAMGLYTAALLDKKIPDLSDTFKPTTLDVADAIVDKAAADANQG